MTRTPRSSRSCIILGVLASVALIAACGGDGDEEPTELTGLIVDVRGRGDDVPSFTLESGGKEYEIQIAADVDYGFRLGHLRTHERALYPVRCSVERRNGKLYALEILDA